jgi:hypothetical protein
MPLSEELGDGWVRLPMETASPAPDSSGSICPLVATSVPPAVPVAGEVHAEYDGGPRLAGVFVTPFPTPEQAADAVRVALARVDGCGSTFTYVTDSGLSLPVTAETYVSPVPGAQCRRLSLTDGRTQWYAMCWHAVGARTVAVRVMADRDEAPAIASRALERTVTRVGAL